MPSFTAEGFINAFSTRKGGVSSGELGSLNLGFTRGDRRENVEENYRRMTSAIGVSVDSLVLSAQTHTANVRRVTYAERGAGYSRPGFSDVDALTTDSRGVTLVTFYADCTPVFLADPRNRAVCLVHSGWRGTVQKIAAAAVGEMARLYGSRPSELIAAIGPSAGPCCYEVSQEVGGQIDEAGGGGCLIHGGGKPFADLWRANAAILKAAGVADGRITVCAECTVHNDIYYSHRRQGAARGSLAAFLSAENEEERK